MFLLEHDAKSMLSSGGIPVPHGFFVTSMDMLPETQPDGGGWVVKAQILAGGRGKLGGIRMAPTWAGVEPEIAAMLGRAIAGHTVHAVRIEPRMHAASEAYISLSVSPATRKIQVILSSVGGVEIEALHRSGGPVRSAQAAATANAVATCILGLTEGMHDAAATALADAGKRLANLFFAHDLTLLEINPLFVFADGSWCAGDAKVVVDDNATGRQAFLRNLLAQKASFYPDAARKAEHEFDYLVIDPAGEVGLLTTGAGLSMLLIDELRAGGLRPYNFLDVRTGGLNGDASRLVQVLRWIAQGPSVRALFCNIFAGATDLGAFARLLLEARAAVPALTVPMVIRLVGNGAEEARAVLTAAGLSMTSDLDEAVLSLRRALGQAS